MMYSLAIYWESPEGTEGVDWHHNLRSLAVAKKVAASETLRLRQHRFSSAIQLFDVTNERSLREDDFAAELSELIEEEHRGR